MPSQVYTQVFTYVNNACNGYIGDNVAAVAAAIAPAAYSLLGVYVILWGLMSMRGLIQEPILEAAVRFMKIAFIFGIGIQLAEYNTYVTDTFFNGPEQLASVLTHSTANGTAISSLDQILDQGFKIGKTFWDQGGIIMGDFGMYMVALLVWAMTIAVTAYACFLIVLAKIALSLIIALGPLFIISLLFQPTANFFNSWIQQMSNYFLLMVLVIAANVFVMTLFMRAANGATAITSTAQIDQLFPFLITGAVSLLVIAQLPQLAAGLAGGISLSSYGMGRLGLSVLSRPGRDLASAGYRGGKRAAASGSKKAARAGWNATGGRAYSAFKNRNRNSVASS
ncbi:Type IV secretion system protein VirB6 [Paraburkholderia aspalathi]|uniref:type IV secretion system protein n=1 Tax=Paraburkholderia aspalathi TaxID=1324617 RepID=UPI001B256067|nr:type IV secretion system protein [Paraburkholderia aspalathi]CAE6850422.1 Type IV secretion system protein VirB6 [Paraburkholderia aspalathi]